MSFLPHLEALVSQVDGAIAASVMGFDGIAVETHQSKAGAEAAAELDLTGAWVEYGNLLQQLKNIAQTLKTGGVSELSVNSEKLITLMRLITPEYFLVVGLRPEGNYGKARYVMRVTAPKLKADL
jgi:predicted regulator of Ras-like GTPase activity (Roadblock/LC7/MglB family)